MKLIDQLEFVKIKIISVCVAPEVEYDLLRTTGDNKTVKISQAARTLMKTEFNSSHVV